MNVPYIITPTNATFFYQGKAHTVNAANPAFPSVVAAIYDGEWDEALRLTDLVTTISNYGQGNITVANDAVYYKGTQVHNVLTDRILRMHAHELPIEPMLRFLDNLMDNPSNRAVQELYGFLEHGNLPITPDGHFLAYKRIRDDWTDCHSGKIDNSIGQVVEMARNLVNDISENTCSHGLHFCSFDYLRSFWGQRLIAIKINPRDVVSIPVDYNNTKGRCCRYEVVAELDMPEDFRAADRKNIWEDVPVIDIDGDVEDYDDADENDYDDDNDENDYDDELREDQERQAELEAYQDELIKHRVTLKERMRQALLDDDVDYLRELSEELEQLNEDIENTGYDIANA